MSERWCNNLFIMSLLLKNKSVEIAFGVLTGVLRVREVCPGVPRYRYRYDQLFSSSILEISTASLSASLGVAAGYASAISPGYASAISLLRVPRTASI